MKLGNIDRTKDGPAILTRRLNQLQHAVNYLMRKKRDDITPRVRGGVGTAVVWFGLTDISESPMEGIRKAFDSDTENWINVWDEWEAWTAKEWPEGSRVKHDDDYWIANTDTEEEPGVGVNWDEYREDIYPHPEAEITDYEIDQIVPCVKSGGQWHSLDGVAGEGVGIVYAEVVETLERDYYDTEEEMLVEGTSKYTMRIITADYPVWDAYTEYLLDAMVVDPDDNRLYKSLVVENEGNKPSESPAEWELQDEIIPWHLGRGDVDFRKFIPWFVVGEVVPLVRTTIEDHDLEPQYYILQMLIYTGDCLPSLMFLPSEGDEGGETHAVFG